MLVRFLVDYRGVLTGEIFYEAGTEVDIESNSAMRLIADKRAEMVEQEPEPVKPAPAKPRRARKPKAK